MQHTFKLSILVALLILIGVRPSHATVFGEVQGIVHDSQHRPIADAQVTIRATDSQVAQTAHTDDNGYFSFPTLPLGTYNITIESRGFNVMRQVLTVFSDN